VGGAVNVISGKARDGLSGDVIVSTAGTKSSREFSRESGGPQPEAVGTGDLRLRTGHLIEPASGRSGVVELASGSTLGKGGSGDVRVATGDAPDGRAGHIEVTAGNFNSASSASTGGGVILRAGSAEDNVHGGDIRIEGGSTDRGQGGSTTLIAGSSNLEGAGGTAAVLAAGGSAGLEVHDNALHLTAGVGPEIGSLAEIGLGFRTLHSENTEHSVSGLNTPTSYDVRLQYRKSDKGLGSKLVSNVPFQLTTVEYSSDERIKQHIVDADTDQLLQRIQQVL